MKRNPICVQPKGENMNKFLKITERNKIEIMQVLPSDSYTSKLALYFQNFADQTRIKILSALSIQDLCVNDLSKILGINQTTISHQLSHVKILLCVYNFQHH